MLRLAIILILLCFLCRWALGKWPWDMLAGPPTRAQKLAEARKHLGVARGASREEILSAHKRILAEVHPDRGGSNADVHDANDARDLLLSEFPPVEPPDSASQD